MADALFLKHQIKKEGEEEMWNYNSMLFIAPRRISLLPIFSLNKEAEFPDQFHNVHLELKLS